MNFGKDIDNAKPYFLLGKSSKPPSIISKSEVITIKYVTIETNQSSVFY